MRRVIITLDESSPSSGWWTVEDWTIIEGCPDRVVRAAFEHMTTDLIGEDLPWKSILRTAAGDLV